MRWTYTRAHEVLHLALFLKLGAFTCVGVSEALVLSDAKKNGDEVIFFAFTHW